MTTVNLPEVLFAPAMTEGEGESVTYNLLKATSPEGISTPIVFTKLEYLQYFAKETGLDQHKPAIGHIQIQAGALLQQLAETGEPEVFVDPMQESETKLSYQSNGVLTRQIADTDAVFEIQKPEEEFDSEMVDKLRNVAANLPHVIRVWMMELKITDSTDDDKTPVPRPLLVVEQDIDEEHDEYQDTWMELGDQWCEGLPRGTAVDMLPHNAPPVQNHLNDDCLVFERKV